MSTTGTTEHKIVIPVPDPTLLTTQQLIREIAALKELMFSRFELCETQARIAEAAINEKFDLTGRIFRERTDALRHQIDTLMEIESRFIPRVEERIHFMRDTHDQRFKSVDAAMSQSKEAVTLARAADRELMSSQYANMTAIISRQDAAINKQLDSIDAGMKQTAKSTDEKIGDLKDRVVAWEGKDRSDQQHSQQSNWAIGLIVGVIISIVEIVLHFSGKI